MRLPINVLQIGEILTSFMNVELPKLVDKERFDQRLGSLLNEAGQIQLLMYNKCGRRAAGTAAG